MNSTTSRCEGGGQLGERADGVSDHTRFLRLVTASRTDATAATAAAIRHGRTQQLWQAGITGAGRRLIAGGRVRLQNAGPRT